VDEVLSSTSDVLFPGELGERPVAMNSMGIDGDTPLHVLAWRDDVEGAKLLVEAGADVNAVGDMSNTALDIAVQRQQLEFVTLLLQAGANPDVRSEFGKTAREDALYLGGAIAHLLTACPTRR
jgi:uncharacterized protein